MIQIMQNSYVHLNKIGLFECFGCFNIIEYKIMVLGTKDARQAYRLECGFTWKVLWGGMHAACPALVW